MDELKLQLYVAFQERTIWLLNAEWKWKLKPSQFYVSQLIRKLNVKKLK